MVIDILTRLPVKSIIRFMSTCKPWHNFLNEPKFSQMHLNKAISRGNDCLLLRYLSARMVADREIQQTLSSGLWTGGFHVSNHKKVYSFRSKNNFKELGKIEEPYSKYNLMVGSINGIVCLINEHKNFSDSLERLCLWNPAIRELKVLPGPFVQRCNAYKTVGVGFACVQSSNDYKVVVILKFNGTETHKVMVYSLSTDCWNESGMLITGQFHDRLSKVYVNGRLHWLNYKATTKEHSILCLETNEEMYYTIELPVVASRAYRVNILPSPPRLGKSLVALTSSYGEGSDLWFMREYGIQQSWTKLYTIPQWLAHRMEPLGWFNDDVMISMITENRLLISYNLLDKKIKTLHVRVATPACYGKYILSLISVGGMKLLPNRHPAYSDTSTVGQLKMKSH